VYCSQENLKDLPRLYENLWDMGISNVHLRRRIINFWARSIGIKVPKELTQQFIVHDQSAPEATVRNSSGGLRWIVEDDGAGNPKLRPSRQNEAGMTLAEAKAAIREMRDQGGQGAEPIVEFNAETQQYTPNPKSAWVKANPAAAWATAHDFTRHMQEGNPADPVDIMAEQLSRVETIKQSLGLKPDAKTGTDDVFDAIAKVDEIARNRNQGGGQPAWMADPVTFVNTIRNMNPQPTGPDPVIMAQMAEMKEDVKAARAENQALKDQIQNDRMEALRQQNQAILTQLQEVRTELARPRDGVTALGVIDKMGGKGIEELSGLRKDIKNLAETAITSGGPTQDAPTRAARVAGMKEALATADRLGQLTDDLELALKG
jgi:type II secretory pathway pseudopilin PulG